LPIVAIDGPAGAGKSTAARWLAYQLGFKLIDTGALYRSLTLMAIERGLDLTSGPSLAYHCSKMKFQFGTLERPLKGDGGGESPMDFSQGVPKLKIYCDGVDVTEAIRRPEIGMATSTLSKLPEVREALLEVQRDFGVEGGIVMEGRDIGTVIFPNADVKFYLTATIESRAQRRWEELKAAGVDRELETVIRETRARDEQDMNRPIAPLKRAEDAIFIDSSNKNLEEVVSQMAKTVRDFLNKKSTTVISSI
jgi:cytidylate kinase